MASKPVKEKLQQSILLRQDRRNKRDSEFLRDLAHIPEHATQSHHPNPPASPKHRSMQLWRTASKFALKRKPARSMSRKDSVHHNPSTLSPGKHPTINTHDICCGNSNTSVSEHRSSSNNSENQLQALDSKQLYHEDTGMSSLHSHLDVSPGQETIAATFSSMFHPVVFLKDTDLLQSHSSFHSTDLPGVQVMVSQHRPLVKSHSQPIMLQENYTQCHFYQVCSPESGRSLYTPEIQLKGWQISSVHQDPGLEERKESGKIAPVDGARVRYSVECNCSSCHPDELSHSSCTCLKCQHCQQRPHARRARSFPLFYVPDTARSVSVDTHSTGLVYDGQILKSHCSSDDSCSDHDNTGRKQSVWLRLLASGLSNQCKMILAKQASIEDIQAVHQDSYVTPYGTNPLSRLQLSAARMAAGAVTELALLVAQGQLRNGFAIVTPQRGSHSSPSKLMGSFSSVAIAAKQLQQKLKVRKILIVDWDVHHCNITQKTFYTDPGVLYISLHRYCERTDNPESGGPNQVGSGEGEGFNINVTWSANLDPPVGDAEYLAAFRTVVMPIAVEFSPDIILISSEFNAVEGHSASHGGHRVSAKCFGMLTRNLMQLARDRVVLVLERVHDLKAICDASEVCIKTLLENKVAPLSDEVLKKKPCANAVQSLQKVLQIQSKYWSSARALAQTVAESWLQAERCSTDNDAAMALASLTMTSHQSPRYSHGRNEPVEHDEDEFYM